MVKILTAMCALALFATAADARNLGSSRADKEAAGWTDVGPGNQGNGKGNGNAGGTPPEDDSGDETEGE